MSGGRVYLVGSGPGDPGLLTVKGLRLIRAADVIVYDRLANPDLLDHARDDAELIDAGKAPGDRGRKQAEINRLLADRARDGKRVVRLKGGDPFVFGRGGEEAEALRAAGVDFEIVPGVTSAIAAPAYAGIPMTHRDSSSSFTVVTGSAALREDERGEWSALARAPGTLVILMGWRALSEIAAALIQGGKPADTPAAVVSWGTTARQKSVSARLDSIAETARAAGLEAPAAVVVGEVALLRERLNWFESLPLFGRRILVPRSRSQASALSRRLAELGAEPVEIPTIEIQPPQDFSELDSSLRALPDFDWVVFTSANAVRSVFGRLSEMGADARNFHGVEAAAIGSATRSALLDRGISADLVAGASNSGGLAKSLAEAGIAGKRILLPRANIATETLPANLREAGAEVVEVEAYRTVVPEGSRQAAADAIGAGIDAAAFTSSSTVVNLIELLDGDLKALDGVSVACIGPVTAATAGRLGLKVDIVADVQNIDGLARAVQSVIGDRDSRAAR